MRETSCRLLDFRIQLFMEALFFYVAPLHLLEPFLIVKTLHANFLIGELKMMDFSTVPLSSFCSLQYVVTSFVSLSMNERVLSHSESGFIKKVVFHCFSFC